MRGITVFPKRSIARKQVVAVTGVLLLVFVFFHLAGNMYIFSGPDKFNSYASVLKKLRPWLYFLEVGLALLALVHIYFTITLVIENLRARGQRYAVYRSVGERTLGSRLMPFTGSAILLFVFLHIWDFTFADLGARSFIDVFDPDTEETIAVNFELYGVVYNSFRDPVHCMAYVVAMMALGFHLTHAIQGAVQTFGLGDLRYMPAIRLLSWLIGIAVAVLYISVPVLIGIGIVEP